MSIQGDHEPEPSQARAPHARTLYFSHRLVVIVKFPTQNLKMSMLSAVPKTYKRKPSVKICSTRQLCKGALNSMYSDIASVASVKGELRLPRSLCRMGHRLRRKHRHGRDLPNTTYSFQKA